jgi:GcrA cell cycle regulator
MDALGTPRRPRDEIWTDERVELLKKLWLEGLSGTDIAKVMGNGFTRNGIIAKVHRLKLSGRRRSARTRTQSKPSQKRRPAATAASPRESAKPQAEEVRHEAYAEPHAKELYIPENQRLNLMQINEHTCKWPIGDPLTDDFYFCGQKAGEKSPYCEFHSRRAYQQIEKTPAA